MRRLLPEPGEADPLTDYLAAPRPAPPDRPWVVVGMVTSLDGASTAGDGRSGGLGGPADKEVFRAVRAIADVVMAGGGTVRAEEYGPVRIAREVREAREAAGRSTDPPRLAVVSGSLDLDPDAPCFTDAPVQPIVFTTERADDAAVAAFRDRADIRVVGVDTVDPAAALASLQRDGAGVVLSEGGPHWNGTLVSADLVDELCLTISPQVAGGDSARIAAGGSVGDRRYELASLLIADDMLIGRWVRAGVLSGS